MFVYDDEDTVFGAIFERPILNVTVLYSTKPPRGKVHTTNIIVPREKDFLNRISQNQSSSAPDPSVLKTTHLELMNHDRHSSLKIHELTLFT